MTLPIFIVDAFTNEAFKGNGAAVCLLPFQKVIPNDVKQKIAAEMNLSETVFISILNEKDTFENGKRFALQWFTPTCEVPLCGHATLASAAVLFSEYQNKSPVIEFEAISGILKAKQVTPNKIEIDLPAYESKPVDMKMFGKVVKAAAGSLPVEEVVLSTSKKLLIRLQDTVTRQQMQELKPLSEELLSGASDIVGVIISLKGSGLDDCKDKQGKAYDFISRYFAPWMGILEDPVTGSAHSVLGPFWSKILKKDELYARQCSTRGGDLNVRVVQDRVAITGDTVVVVRGQISF